MISYFLNTFVSKILVFSLNKILNIIDQYLEIFKVKDQIAKSVYTMIKNLFIVSH